MSTTDEDNILFMHHKALRMYQPLFDRSLVPCCAAVTLTPLGAPIGAVPVTPLAGEAVARK